MALTPVQVANLKTLGKVWGFLKYHHPEITAGGRDWDRDLLEIMPQVVSASDSATAQAILLKWVTRLMPVGECPECSPPTRALLENDVALRAGNEWISDRALLRSELSDYLKRVYTNRRVAQQHYVSLPQPLSSPEFPNEPAYADMQPDFGLQILSLFRFWNAIEYWFPYRAEIGANWDDVLAEFLPRIGLARTLLDYQRGIIELAARTNDSHTQVFAPLAASPPEGTCIVPVVVRFVENRAVVTNTLPRAVGPEAPERGDVIEGIDGSAVSSLIATWAPYYSASNDAARLRNIAIGMMRGVCGEAVLRVSRSGIEKTIHTKRVAIRDIRREWIDLSESHELPGPAFRKLSEQVAYLKISTLKSAAVRGYLENVRGALGSLPKSGALHFMPQKGLIVDLRGHPSEAVWGELVGSLGAGGNFAKYSVADLSNPGAFIWREMPPGPAHPTSDYGKIIVLVDELTQSNVEFGAMALRTIPGALIVGSQTAGADGTITNITLPGGIRVQFTGLGVAYPDGTPTQRVGIRLDLRVEPTIAGIAAGRDEILEAAMGRIEK